MSMTPWVQTSLSYYIQNLPNGISKHEKESKNSKHWTMNKIVDLASSSHVAGVVSRKH